MSHGITIDLDDFNSDEEKVGSDVEEVRKWDHDLRETKTFSTAFLILSGRRFESPNLEELSKVLLKFIGPPTKDYFLCRSTQAKAFDELIADCKRGWKSEASRKKKWSVRFVAENLALLLVLRRQVEKEKVARLEVSTRSASGGRPKSNDLKRAFRKLWTIYEKSLKLYVQAEKDEENKVHRTPSLNVQLTGTRDQDKVPWGKWTKYESNCPMCVHASTMPMQSREDINAANARLREDAEANDGDGKFEGMATKVGCYCYGQNCFGDEYGIGCWHCVDLAMTIGEVPAVEVDPGLCRFDCDICRCSCQVIFDDNKRHTIANSLKKNAMKSTPIESREAQREGGRSIFFDYVKNSLDNNSVREYQDVDYRSEFDRISDVATKTAIAISNNTAMQCNPKVTRGLQELIRGRQTNIEMTPAGAGGGRKVSMSISQARKELKGRSDGATRKDPPETLQSINNYTPPDSNFGSNAGNRWHRNNLSSAQLHPVLNTWNPKATTVSSPPMMERVQKRVMDTLFDAATTPQTRRVVAKVHAQLAQKDATFTIVVDRYQEVKSSQEISTSCIDLQRALG